MGPYWPLWRLEEQGELRMGPCYHTDQYLRPLPGNNTLPTRSDFCFSHSNNATPHSVNCDLRRHSGSALSSHELDLTVPVPVISPPQIKLSPDWVSLRKSASPLYLTSPSSQWSVSVSISARELARAGPVNLVPTSRIARTDSHVRFYSL